MSPEWVQGSGPLRRASWVSQEMPHTRSTMETVTGFSALQGPEKVGSKEEKRISDFNSALPKMM